MSNIEDKIKDIIINSEHSDIDKSELIKKLCLIFPNIKTAPKSSTIIKKGTMDNKNEIILEEFLYGDTILYTDKNNNVWDDSAEIVGILHNGKPMYWKSTNEDIKWNDIKK